MVGCSSRMLLAGRVGRPFVQVSRQACSISYESRDVSRALETHTLRTRDSRRRGARGFPMIEVRASEGTSEAAPSQAHLLPCEIQATGPALVSAYFQPQAREKSQEAAFRGRGLKGAEVPLPPGYAGAMLADTVSADVADGEERRWVHRGVIDKFTFWKHDELPHGEEPILKAMRWAELADVLHADHGEDEL